MAVENKYIRTLAPAGAVANFISITGDSHRYFWANSSLIELMLTRGIRVFEKLATPASTGEKEVELTLDNYTNNNNGVVFDEDAGDIVVKNLEQERADELKEYQEAFLEELGLEMAEKNEERIAKLNAKENNSATITGSAEPMIDEEDDNEDEDGKDTDLENDNP